MSATRFGIVGLGHAGLSQYTAITERTDASVVAVADTNPQLITTPPDSINIHAASRYSRPHEMIETESINALVVATPPSSHAEYISTALDHELHVLCEKPLCLTLSQGKKLLAQNRRTDSVIRVGFQRRSNPSYQAVRDAIQSANLTGFTVEMYSDWFPRFEDTWRTDPEISGGGLTFDMGAHFVDILPWLTGRDPSVVRADMEFTDNGRIDSRSALTLRLDGGIRGTLLFLGRVSCAQERLRLQAEQGQVEITATDWGPRTAIRVDANGNEMALTDGSKTSQAEQFVAATRGQRTELTTLEEAFRGLKTIQAAYEAARTGRAVEVERLEKTDDR